MSLSNTPSLQPVTTASDIRDQSWSFWVDRGGTFTDFVAIKPSGEIASYKLLSVNPEHYSDAAIEGIRRLLEQSPEEGRIISDVKMGTTVATNALLERKGQPVFLMITGGLIDQLEIGYQTRPDIFAVHIDKPAPLYSQVVGVPERIRADGTVEHVLDELGVRIQLEAAKKAGIESVAVVLMHSYRYPDHEIRIGQLAEEVGFKQVSLSHEASPLIKLVPRGQTCVLDAYLTPVLRNYVSTVESELKKLDASAQLQFMQSNGGLTRSEDFIGRDAVLSGPAGGVVGMAKTAEADGYSRLIGFDMGGTSTDVSHYAGRLERETETEVCGVRLRAPMMNIHTVAAGGGSIVHFSDGRLQVGPESAGAFPGPACYRNGGPLTVTDCNVLLGKIQPDLFPKVFGPEQNLPLDKKVVQQAFSSLAQEVSVQTGYSYSPESLAEAFLAIAVDNMAAAAKKISVQRGFDVRDYALCSFGGAGAQHACLVADAMGMKEVYLHPMAGVLSAFGIGLADRRWVGEQSFEQNLAADNEERLFQDLSSEFQSLKEQSPLRTDPSCLEERRAYLSYQGSDTQLLVSINSTEAMRGEFERQHRQLFGFIQSETCIRITAIQLEHCCPGAELPEIKNAPSAELSKEAVELEMYLSGDWHSVPVLQRENLANDFQADGPLLIAESNSTIIVEPDWSCRRITSGALILTREEKEDLSLTAVSFSGSPDPMQLEIFNHLFMSVAEQMGSVLERTATSVNIKERLDFSCAVFDRKGELVANAPHIPVHLGSMSESVQVVMKDHPDLGPDDAVVLNTPYNGGTHLPDVTVVKPVFIDSVDTDTAVDSKGRPDFYVAARGHHADIGGITPGSMPADSRHIEEEGVLLDSLLLVQDGVFQQQEMLNALSSVTYPARNPAQNLADLKAQLASCEKGALELQRLAKAYGVDQLHAYMGFVQDNAEQSLRNCLASLPSGEFETLMDDGSCVKVSIEVDQAS